MSSLGEARINFGRLQTDSKSNSVQGMTHLQMENLSKEEFVLILRRHGTGFSRGSSKYRGVTLHKCGRWEARMGQFLGKKWGPINWFIFFFPDCFYFWVIVRGIWLFRPVKQHIGTYIQCVLIPVQGKLPHLALFKRRISPHTAVINVVCIKTLLWSWLLNIHPMVRNLYVI